VLLRPCRFHRAIETRSVSEEHHQPTFSRVPDLACQTAQLQTASASNTTNRLVSPLPGPSPPSAQLQWKRSGKHILRIRVPVRRKVCAKRNDPSCPRAVLIACDILSVVPAKASRRLERRRFARRALAATAVVVKLAGVGPIDPPSLAKHLGSGNWQPPAPVSGFPRRRKSVCDLQPSSGLA